MSHFSTRLDYGISFKSLYPDATNEEIEEIAGKIRRARETLEIEVKLTFSESILQYYFSTKSHDDREGTSDIIFYVNGDNEVYEDDLSLTKTIELRDLAIFEDRYKSTIAYECLVLLKILGYEQEFTLNPTWILYLKED